MEMLMFSQGCAEAHPWGNFAAKWPHETGREDDAWT
jgi:hypothetical protein